MNFVKSSLCSLMLVFLLITIQESDGQNKPAPQKPFRGAPVPNYSGVHPNQKGITDGHRLITRALWRIFDAIMQKKSHDTLYGRMKFVEGTLNEIVTSDSSIDKKIDTISTTVRNHKNKLETIRKEVDKIKNLETRIREIEEWQLRLERPRDDEESAPLTLVQPGFSTCPPPFETAEGECIYVSTAEKLSWRAARRECARLGGDLTSPRDLSALRSYLKSMPSADRPEYVWIGGSKVMDDQWVWTSGNRAASPIDMSQNTWNEKLPEGAGNCMGLYERAAFRAYDYACTEKDFFICQYFF